MLASPPPTTAALAAPPCLIALTGGPSAGKTAVLAAVGAAFGRRVALVPEAATILYAGGFPRRPTIAARRAVQRAIFHVQRQLERMAIEDGGEVVLCDRGTLDGLAYWPGAPSALWADVGSSRAAELARYAAVLHLHTPPDGRGFDGSNPVRRESAAEALRLDAALERAWRGHPRRTFVPATAAFSAKVERVLAILARELAGREGHRLDR